MLSGLDSLAGTVAVVIGVVLVWLARRGLASVRMVISQRTVSVGALAPGPAEIAGTVHASSASLQSLNGISAVAVHTRVEALVASGRSASWVEAGRCTDAVEAEVRDPSGTCSLVLNEPAIVGPTWRSTVNEVQFRQIAPQIAARTLSNPARGDYAGHQLRVSQTVIADGASVLVEGEAAEIGLTDGLGYRDARARYALRDADGRALLLSGLSHRATVWRTAWPALTVALSGALLVAMGLAWLGVSAWLASKIP